MNQLQIKSTIIDLENKLDKNGNPFYKISLHGFSARYFYVFSYNLPEQTLTLLKSPHNLVNRQVLITYEELPNKDGQGTFFKVQQIEIL
jgi:hypothetical protein